MTRAIPKRPASPEGGREPSLDQRAFDAATGRAAPTAPGPAPTPRRPETAPDEQEQREAALLMQSLFAGLAAATNVEEWRLGDRALPIIGTDAALVRRKYLSGDAGSSPEARLAIMLSGHLLQGARATYDKYKDTLRARRAPARADGASAQSAGGGRRPENPDPRDVGNGQIDARVEVVGTMVEGDPS
jgi:hypothetical protein